MPEEGINPEELPPVASHVWQWFLQLNASRQGGMSGPLPLSNTEILAFFQLEGLWPEPWELQALRALDGVALASDEKG